MAMEIANATINSSNGNPLGTDLSAPSQRFVSKASLCAHTLRASHSLKLRGCGMRGDDKWVPTVFAVTFG
jgi:hypothetical protein